MVQEMSANDSITAADPVLLQNSPVQQEEAEQNVSSGKSQGNGAGHYAAVTLMVGVSCLAVAGNAWNLLMVARTPHLRKTLSNLFVLSLCTCDLLAGLLVMPAAASAFVSGEWLLGDTACRAAGFLGAWLTFVSMTTVSLISAERFYCLRWIMHHAVFMTFQKALGAALLVWGWGALMAALPLAGLNSYDYRPSLCNCSFAAKPESGHVTYVILVTTLCYLVPGAVVVVMYAGIFWVAHQAAVQVGPLPMGVIAKTPEHEPVAPQTNRSPPAPTPAWTIPRITNITTLTTSATSPPSTDSKASRATRTADVKATAASPAPGPSPERPSFALWNSSKLGSVHCCLKAAKTILVLVVSSTALWGPLFALHLHGAIRPSSSLLSDSGLAAQWLGFTSFALNPLLYGWMNAAIREELVAACRFVCCCWCWGSRCCKCMRRKDPGDEEMEEMEREENSEDEGEGNVDFLQFLQRTSRISQLSQIPLEGQTPPGDRRDTCQVPRRERPDTGQALFARGLFVQDVVENSKPF